MTERSTRGDERAPEAPGPGSQGPPGRRATLRAVSRRSRRLVAGTAVAGLLLVAGCAGASDNAETVPGPPGSDQDALNPTGESADKIFDLSAPFALIAAAIGVLVLTAVVYAAFRYRARSDDERPRQVHGSTGLEVGWTIVPALILVVMAVPTVSLVFDLAEAPEGDDVVEITVTGKQWWWQYEYVSEGGFYTANEMHIPVDRPTYLTLTSDNVIHSFWVPNLAGKQDLVPGRAHNLKLEPTETGLFLGQCAEYCGLSHANMRLRVYVDTEEDYRAWVAQQQEGPSAQQQQLAEEGLVSGNGYGCTSCHSFDSSTDTGIGPNLAHVGGRDTFAGAMFPLTEEELRLWVHDAPSRKPAQADKGVGMPSFADTMTDEDLDTIVSFLLDSR